MKTIYDNEMLLRSTLFPFVATIAQQFGDAQLHSVTLLLYYFFFNFSITRIMDEQRNHMCQSKYLYSCCMHVLSTFIISILLDPKFFSSLRLSGK